MDIEKVKRYSLTEIVLLAILMIGLFIAGLIVKKSARILLSDPLTLFGSGLSVAMPANPGWEHTPVWQYEGSESCMTLVAQFGSPRRGRIAVRWRYIFSTPAGSEQELLTRHAYEAAATIHGVEKIGRQHPMIYARMISNSAATADQFYLGIMRLDDNRSVELIVQSSGVSGLYEENVFRSLAESIQYQKPQQQTDGLAFMDEFLQVQSQSLSGELLSDEAFLIKDAVRGRPLGYYSARYSLYNDQEQALRQLQIQHLESGALKLESSLWFDTAQKDYRWETDLIRPGTAEAQEYRIRSDESGRLSVECNVKDTKTFPADQFFLPEPLLHELARQFLRSEYDDVIVDVLSAAGQLVPVCLEKISPDSTKIKPENTKAVVQIVYLHIQNSYEELFFDDAQNLLGKYEQQPRSRPRIWEAVPADELRRIFEHDFQALPDTVACNR
ncbi:MAG: hypothetical protein ABFR90_06300 [Planctomycetota bacterium]